MEAIAVALPMPMCCISGDAPNEPPLETSRYRIGFACPRPASVSLILAPIAARLLFTPTSLIEIQRFECPGFMKSTLLYLSPGTAPPGFRTDLHCRRCPHPRRRLRALSVDVRFHLRS